MKGWKSKHDTQTAYAVMGRKFFGSDRALQVDRSDFNAEMELICLADRQHAPSSSGCVNCSQFNSPSPFLLLTEAELYRLNNKFKKFNKALRPFHSPLLKARRRCVLFNTARQVS